MSKQDRCTGDHKRGVCGDVKCLKSFASHPKAKYWSKTNKLKPWEVAKSCNKKFIFDCNKCKHTFLASSGNVTGGKWCPYCAGKKICDNENCKKCHERSFANQPKAKYWSKNNKLSPRQVAKLSHKKFSFDCNNCKHTFSSSLDQITRGRWCPYCAIPNKKLCDDKDCKSCHERSFASNPKAKYWSKNNKLSPREVSISCHKKFIFDCNKCEHIFTASLAHITNGKWCPYCSCNKLCEDKDCKKCHNRSFASHPKVKYWSKTNKLSPRQVAKSSDKKIHFNCNKCKHTFSATIGHITGGSWCPYCAGKKLCEDKDCKKCHDKSFESHPKSKYWNKNNKLSPRQVAISCYKKFSFNCKCGQVFLSSPNKITNGRWCPRCKNKTEKMLSEWLDTNCDKEVTFQPKYEWCRNPHTTKYFPLDFSIERYKLIIELDGRQHFRQVSSWKSPIKSLKRDLYKTHKCTENGYTVVRLLQEDVYSNKNDWEDRLLPHLRKHSNPKVILLDNKEEYNPLRKALLNAEESGELAELSESEAEQPSDDKSSDEQEEHKSSWRRKGKLISISSSDDEEPDADSKPRKHNSKGGKAKRSSEKIFSKRS